MVVNAKIYVAALICLVLIFLYIGSTNQVVRDELLTFITKTPITARAVFADGDITFKENILDGDIDVNLNIKNEHAADGEYSLIVDRLGDPAHIGAIFSPYDNFSGDLGHIQFMKTYAHHTIKTKNIRLRGTNSIIGRNICIYKNFPDDILESALIGFSDY